MKRTLNSVYVTSDNIIQTVQAHEADIEMLKEHHEQDKSAICRIEESQKADHRLIVAILVIVGITLGNNVIPALINLL